MADRAGQIVLTYYGIDGACAAAAASLISPDATEIHPTSARRVGAAMARLLDRRPRPAAVHVCGLGVWCPWEELADPATALAQAGTDIVWYCGRGYLDAQRADLAAFCRPVFENAGTNTAAIAQAHGFADLPRAQFLMDLAKLDPNLPDPVAVEDRPEPLGEWAELIEGAAAQYVKYLDESFYARTIEKLARGDLDDRDRALLAQHRRTGFRYALQGRSSALRELKVRIQKCAEADRHVLVTGESGTGKEHVAHLVHERAGRRARGPFVPVNCAVFAGNAGLANSMLFGHVKGAFTGATQDREGAFAAADGGILFLDEVGELPPEIQPKFLRVLEDGLVTPEGSDTPTREVDVRVLAATHRDLPAMIGENAFRGDLFHRLSTLRIHVPPLRERPEDIEPVVKKRLARIKAEEGRRRRLTRRDLDVLKTASWPGNMRQLLKVVDRAALLDIPFAEALAEEEIGAARPAPEQADADELVPADPADVLALKEAETIYMRRALAAHEGNKSATARALGVSTNTLRRRIA